MTVTSLSQLPEKDPATFADDEKIHGFRHAVARALGARWPTRAYALLSCGEAGVSLVCRDCDQTHLVAYRCGARACPVCARVASAITVERIARRAQAALTGDLAWDGPGPQRGRKWRLVTLTQRTAGERGSAARFEPRELRRSIVRVRRAFGPWWRSTVWGEPVRYQKAGKGGRVRWTMRARKDTAFAMGVEVAPGGMVHSHVAVYGEFVATHELQSLWEKQIGRTGHVDIALMRAAGDKDFRDALHEVLKYVSKGSKGPGRPGRAANIELAMRSTRRVECGGALRRVPLPAPAEISTESCCLACGHTGWRWQGVRPASYVAQNGGFGLDRWADIHDIPESRGDSRAIQYRSLFGRAAPAVFTPPIEGNSQ